MTDEDRNREVGFYWVIPKFDDEELRDTWWNEEQPAYWDGKHWFLLGSYDHEWGVTCVGDKVTSSTNPLNR